MWKQKSVFGSQMFWATSCTTYINCLTFNPHSIACKTLLPPSPLPPPPPFPLNSLSVHTTVHDAATPPHPTPLTFNPNNIACHHVAVTYSSPSLSLPLIFNPPNILHVSVSPLPTTIPPHSLSVHTVLLVAMLQLPIALPCYLSPPHFQSTQYIACFNFPLHPPPPPTNHSTPLTFSPQNIAC